MMLSDLIASAPHTKSRDARRGFFAAVKICELRGFFGRRRAQVVALLGWRPNHSHFLPVVRKFFAAVKANYVSSG